MSTNIYIIIYIYIHYFEYVAVKPVAVPASTSPQGTPSVVQIAFFSTSQCSVVSVHPLPVTSWTPCFLVNNSRPI